MGTGGEVDWERRREPTKEEEAEREEEHHIRRPEEARDFPEKKSSRGSLTGNLEN